MHEKPTWVVALLKKNKNCETGTMFSNKKRKCKRQIYIRVVKQTVDFGGSGQAVMLDVTQMI
jgi:hypothetical protein